MNDILKTALQAGEAAAKIAKSVRESGNLGLNFKGDVNLCTQADIDAEKAIIDCIRNKYPDHAILSEESNSEIEQKNLVGPLWVIDPIDGTTNYAHGHPHVGISIGFYDRGLAQVGLVNTPFYNEVFTAIRGEGAFLNERKIFVGKTKTIKSALVCTGFPYERDATSPIIQRLEAMLIQCRDIRRLGAASVDTCWVACGRLDLYYEDVMPWDMAAGSLIAKEAGAAIGCFRKTASNSLLPAELRSDGFVVANPELLAEGIKILEMYQ